MFVVIILNLQRLNIKFICLDGSVDSCGVHTGKHIHNVTFIDIEGNKHFFKTLGGADQIRYNTFADFRTVPPGKFCLCVGSWKFFRGKQGATLYAYKSNDGHVLAFDDDFKMAAVGAYMGEFWPRFFTGCFGITPLSFRYIFGTCLCFILLGGITVFVAGYILKTAPDHYHFNALLFLFVVVLMSAFFIGNHTIGVYRKIQNYKHCKQLAKENGIEVI
jgi:hypothetical protein